MGPVRVIANAKHLAAELIQRNFTLLTGGTDNHLLVVDLRGKGVTGRETERFLDKAGLMKREAHNNPEKAKPKKKRQEREAAEAKAAADAAAKPAA